MGTEIVMFSELNGIFCLFVCENLPSSSQPSKGCDKGIWYYKQGTNWVFGGR